MKNFKHKQIEKLYDELLSIDRDLLDEILALPRNEIITDLETLIKDVQENSDLYQNQYEADEDVETDMIVHTFIILAYLKSKDSLPIMLDFLSHQIEINDEFWIYELIGESLANIFHELGVEQENLLFEYASNFENHCESSNDAVVALTLIASENLEKNELIVGYFQQIFQKLLSLKKIENESILDFIYYFCQEISKLQNPILDDLLKQLYDSGCLPEVELEDDQTVSEYLLEVDPFVLEPFPILKIYDDFAEYYDKWASDSRMYQTDYSENYDDDVELTEDDIKDLGEKTYGSSSIKFIPANKVPQDSEKIQRNDPCPCGSGKKYKKCCGA